jgi:hypothetical protein
VELITSTASLYRSTIFDAHDTATVVLSVAVAGFWDLDTVRECLLLVDTFTAGATAIEGENSASLSSFTVDTEHDPFDNDCLIPSWRFDMAADIVVLLVANN